MRMMNSLPDIWWSPSVNSINRHRLVHDRRNCPLRSLTCEENPYDYIRPSIYLLIEEILDLVGKLNCLDSPRGPRFLAIDIEGFIHDSKKRLP
ncbi:hypothetical protein HDF12_004367 [Edaphobacter lichenicola]|uniref:Uncharacterized protein n=1 Tax=Tunturiibacter lichenicola TaxID=2051959 RepID=A0A7Y9T4F8_9BACT|nr:hypothetical protein [Edaphobacter lichenicola]